MYHKRYDRGDFVMSFLYTMDKIATTGLNFDRALVRELPLGWQMQTCAQLMLRLNPLIKQTDYFKDVCKVITPDVTGFASTFYEGLRSDNVKLRSFVLNLFRDYMPLFTDVYGNVTMQHENFLLLYCICKNNLGEDNQYTNIAKALLIMQAAKTFEFQLKALYKESGRNGVIYPKFNYESYYFRWAKHPYITCKFVSALTIPKGFDAYYYEKELMTAAVFVMIAKDMSFVDAMNFVKKREQGVLFTGLTMEQENILMPFILNKMVTGMNGEFAEDYSRMAADVDSKYGTEYHTVYSVLCKPALIKVIELLVDKMEQDIEASVTEKSGKAKVYFLNQNVIGLIVRQGLNISDVTPSVCTKLKRVPKLNLDDFVLGKLW